MLKRIIVLSFFAVVSAHAMENLDKRLSLAHAKRDVNKFKKILITYGSSEKLDKQVDGILMKHIAGIRNAHDLEYYQEKEDTAKLHEMFTLLHWRLNKLKKLEKENEQNGND